MSRRQPGHAGLLRPALSDFFLCSQYLQRVLGVGPLGTGLLFLPIAVVIGVGTHLAVRAVGRFGGRPTATAGFALAAAGALLLSRLPGQGSAWTAVLPGLAVAGLGLGAGFVVATTTALAHVDPHDAGTTSGLVNTGHEIGAGLGIAYVSTLAAPSLSGTGAGGFATAFAGAAVVAAATRVFCEQPQVSMADIARAAGVGRVTLYAHFPSREALLEAVLAGTIAEATAIISATHPDQGPVGEALRRLVRTSWETLDRHRRPFALAQRELGPAALRDRHDPALNPVEALLARGRRDGVIRTGLPLDWLVTTFYTLLHAAAEDVNAGRLPHTDAGRVLDATLTSALAPPA